MKNGQVKISDKCVHCSQCHKVDKGCLIYKSLEMPKGGLKMSTTKSLNSYSHHAPKMDWMVQYFEYKDEFDQKHSLGSQMFSFFKRFLRDAELVDDNRFSDTAKIIENIGLDDEKSWGIMFVNLAYTPQINWFIKRLKMQETYQKEYILSLLMSDGAKESGIKDIWSSFTRLSELPFGKIGMGNATKDTITRMPWENPDPCVILYALFRFAEACGGYYQFTLSRLLNHDIDSEGVSPTEIFGIDREQMKNILNGLSMNYPEFINVSFTLDLENITLHSDKTAQDVLKLFYKM